MVLWILLISMALFAITFIALVNKPVLRYTTSISFLVLAIICSISLMLNDSNHLGMKTQVYTETKDLVSITGKDSPLNLITYKSLGNGDEKIFIYRTADHPNKNCKTKIEYNVTTKVQRGSSETPQVEIKKKHYVYKNEFWRLMFGGLGLNKETYQYTYIFKLPKNWLVLDMKQLQAVKQQAQNDIKQKIQQQLPNVIKTEMEKELQKDPTMSDNQKKKLEQKITAEQKKKLITELTKNTFSKLLPQLEKESL